MKKLIILSLFALGIISCAQFDIFSDWTKKYEKPQSECLLDGTYVDFGDRGIYDCHTIDILDSLILIKCAATKNNDKHYILLDKNRRCFIGDYIYYGNGPDEMLGNRFCGCYGDKALLFSMGENKVMQWNIPQTLKTGQVVLSELFDLPSSCLALVPDDASNQIIVVNHAEQSYNYNIIDSTGVVIKRNPIYSGVDYWTDITYLSDCAALSKDGSTLVLSMTFLPQINYISLVDSRKVTISTNKRVNWNDIRRKDVGRGLKLYYPRIISCEDYFVVLSFADTKYTHLHIFDSNGSFVCDVKTSERLRDIAYDSAARLIYGVDIDSDIYTYDISGLLM